MKALLVARKTLLEMIRDLRSLLILTLMPLAFVGLFAVMGAAPRQPTYPILTSASGVGGERLLRAVEGARYRDGRRMFSLKPTTDAAATDRELRKGAFVAMLRAVGDGSAPAEVTVRGDAVNARFIAAGTLLGSLIERHGSEVSGQSQPLRVVTQPIADAEPSTDFDLFLPGCIVFAILLTIAQTATLLGQERRAGTLQRLSLSRLNSSSLISGVTLAQMALAIIEVALILATARLCGFHNRGSVWLGALLALVLNFSAIGVGLIVACFVKNDSQAGNVGGVAAMLQVFLSGAFFPMPSATLFTVWNHEVSVLDLLPATHCFAALQQTLSFGVGLGQLAFRLGAAIALSLLYFAGGIAVFQRMRMGKGSLG